MLDVCLPGTGGTVPHLERFLCSCYLRYNGTGLLIDCGEGTQLAVKKAGFSLGKIAIGGDLNRRHPAPHGRTSARREQDQMHACGKEICDGYDIVSGTVKK